MDQRTRVASSDYAPGPAIGARQPGSSSVAQSCPQTPGAQALLNLQRLAGNRAVAGMIGHRPTIQRWPVGFNAASEDCVAAANWISSHTPHPRGAWARTFVRFTRGGSVQVSGTGTDLTATVSSPAVTHTKRVDMPTWSPTGPTMSGAWARASSELRAHEAVHESKGDEWQAILESRLTSFSEPVRSRAAGQAELDRQWTQWVADHQAEQDLLDPFSVTLDCSDAGGSSESAAPNLGDELRMDEDTIP